jgi:exosortase A-associated hydrolase 1
VNYTERAAGFECEGEALIGVLALPERPAETAVVVIVGGPQYRSGSHRQFVLLSRKLAAAGHAVLRFDYRGMGDSGGAARSFERVSPDVAAAIGAVMGSSDAISRVVLWGLCDGASAALLYVHDTADRRVAGLALLNPWLRSEPGFARTQVKHYYLRRLAQPEFWKKLVRGHVAKGSMRDLARTLRLSLTRQTPHTRAPENFRDRMLAGVEAFDGPILLLLSGNDLTAREFAQEAAANARWQTALTTRARALQRHDVADADHTFSDPRCRETAEDLTLGWLRRNVETNAPAARQGAFLHGVAT